MAFYSSSSYAGSGFGEYNYNSYAVNYDYAQNPGFMAYNYQQFNTPYYGYDPSSYYDPAPTYPTISYSAVTFSEPKFLVYDPNYDKSQLVIYYSNLEFNEPEFEEYDPTPYDGGYDIVKTYGKPLSPSDQTCYPRSGPVVVTLPAVEKKGTDEKAIVPPQNESTGQVTDKMPQPKISPIADLPEKQEDKIPDTRDLIPSGGVDIKEHEAQEEEEEEDDDEDEDDSRSGYGTGYNGGQYDEYEKPVPTRYPSGYGLEALDLCESLFGYWPCLAKMKREKCCCGGVRDDIERDHCNRETADYLFGSPYPYGGGRGEEGSSYGGAEFVYAYQRPQSQYKQVQNYDNSSWW